ncbi:MAG: CDP-alcohol phosphatidyltransferase family protein [Holosporaceae bacterium]|jgi:cardiolipin synthase|nr:CDP-alcohol phosphatidyltransferase family protein [Holosporaceae bacterium]
MKFIEIAFQKKQVPNFLSLLRIVLAVFFIPLVNGNNFPEALLVFVLAAISDFFDGYLARKWQASSSVGALLDPLADKVLMISAYGVLAFLAYVPFYVAVIVIARDLIILMAVCLCALLGINLEIRPLMSSKINTAIQMMFVIVVVGCCCLSMTMASTEMLITAGMVCLSTVVSAADYLRKYYGMIRNDILNG